MDSFTLENKLVELMGQASLLRQDTQALEARAAVENLMNTYQYYISAYEIEKILTELWAQHTPDTRAEIKNEGVYIGLSSICEIYSSFKKYPGRLYQRFATTPVIEVAQDCQTAKGLWVCLGTESDSRGKYQRVKTHGPYGIFQPKHPEIKPLAQWFWLYCAVDFILEDGSWRIWHLHIYELFDVPFQEDWIAYSAVSTHTGNTNIYYPPADLPPTYTWKYTPDCPTPAEPRVPEPYQTFAKTFSY